MKNWMFSFLSIFFINGQDSIPAAKSSARNESLPKASYQAYKPGERLDYSLRYSFITGGHAIMEVKDEIKPINGTGNYHVYVEGKSNNFFDALFKVRDYYESFIDKSTLLPTVFNRDITENRYKRKESYVFDRTKNVVKMENRTDTVPPGIFDIISAFYYMRCIDFSKAAEGTEYDLNTYFDGKIFPVGATFVGRSVITTGLGKFKVLVFRPKLIEGRVFKNQADMTLYVSDDSNQVPVRIESAVYMDYVRADLEKYSNLKYPLSSKVKN